MVTSSYSRYRRRRRLTTVAALLFAAALGALGAYLVFGGPRTRAHSEGAMAAPSGQVPKSTAERDKEARVRARVKVDEAEAALSRGDLAGAEAAAVAARALDERYPDAARVLAVIHTRTGKAHEACRLMGEYVRLAQTPEPARARLLESACTLDEGAAPR